MTSGFSIWIFPACIRRKCNIKNISYMPYVLESVFRNKTWSLNATIDCSIVEWSQFIKFSVHKSNLWAFLEKAWTLSRTLFITSSSACNIYLFHAEICRYLKNFCCAFYCMKSSVWISQYYISLYFWCILIKYFDQILNQCYSRKTRYNRKIPLSLYIFVVLNH